MNCNDEMMALNNHNNYNNGEGEDGKNYGSCDRMIMAYEPFSMRNFPTAAIAKYHQNNDNDDDEKKTHFQNNGAIHALSLFCNEEEANEDLSFSESRLLENEPKSAEIIELHDDERWNEIQAKQRRFEKTALISTFAVNVILLGIKIAITVLSASVVLLASMIDSLLDVLTTAILYFAQSYSKKLDFDIARYPVGRTRIQPIGIIIFAAMMAMASVEIITEAINSLVKGFSNDGDIPELNVGVLSISTFIAIIIVKLSLFIFCKILQRRYVDVRKQDEIKVNESVQIAPRKKEEEYIRKRRGKVRQDKAKNERKAENTEIEKSSAIDALCQDHFNDVLSNSFSIIVAAIASRYKSEIWYLDPIGAVFISLWIIIGWIGQAKEHMQHLIGVSAPEELRDELQQIALKHDPRILAVDSLIAYYLGDNLIVECHIVLPPNMFLHEAHDIGESLEEEFERSHRIERAFVHVDYENGHELEHSHALEHLA